MVNIVDANDKFFQRWKEASHQAYAKGFEETLTKGLLNDGTFATLVKTTLNDWITYTKGEHWVNFIDGLTGEGEVNDAKWDMGFQAFSTIGEIYENKKNVVFMQLFYWSDAPVILHPKPLDVNAPLMEYLNTVPGSEEIKEGVVLFHIFLKLALMVTLNQGFVCVKSSVNERQTLKFTFHKGAETVVIEYNQPAVYPEIEIFLELVSKMKAGETSV